MLPMLQPEPTLNCGGQTVSGPSTPSASLPPSLTPESDADDIVVSFFDIDVAIQRIESCDLQPGDTWRGMQGKMSVTAPVKKIRKKSDHKPQSQINKSHNEKRRRDLENEAINQLEELLSSCLEAVKQPDKNGIVREATKQIQEVLNRRRECPLECPTRSPGLPLSPLQGGEVSSTQPHSSLHYSELTTLIEALKHYTSSLGLVLLEINCKGEIVCVTENIKDLINLDRNELYKKSIFSLLHINDHSKIRPLLRSVQSFGWGADSEGLQAVQAKLLLKTSNVPESAGYVEALIHCAPVRGSGTEAGGSVMCVIRRCEDASAAILPARPRPPHVPDHITFRLDTTFTILSCDLSGVEHCINSNAFFVGKRYLDFVESADRHIALSHLREVACHPVPPAISEPFRLCITADKPWLRVSARSRLFTAKPPTGEPNFIMATHNVLPEDELIEPNTVNPSVGGPLMTSVANGEPSAGGERYRSPISPEESFSMNDFDLEWPSQFALSEPMSEDPSDRRDSTSEGPLTPRTPQTPQSEPPPPPQEEPNRLRTLLSKKPSGILTGLLQQPDEEDATSSETSAPHTPHTPHTPVAAMSPLHTPRAPLTPAAPIGPAHSQHSMHQPHDSNSQMLLRILNEKSDEDGDENRRNSQDGRTSQPSALLTQLLSSNGPSSNGRSQDVSDSYLERLGVKRKLPEIPAAAKRATPETQQVSSSAAPAASSSSTTSSSPASSSAGMSPLCQKNQILVSLLARQQQTPLPVSNQIQRAFGPRPRPHQHLPLQHPQGMMQHQPRQMQNMMQHHPRASNVNGGPGLPGVSQANVECSTANTTPSYPSHAATQSHLQMVLQGGSRASYQSPAPPPQHHQPLHYANTPPHHIYNNQPQSGNTRLQQSGGSELPNDQVLSDILDEVIENMPDSDRSGSDVMMMGMEGNRQLRPDYNAGMKEQNAVINAIRQSLMQCEKQTKSPVSSSPGPGPPPVYSVQSPGPCNIGGSLYTLGNASVQTTVAGAGVGGGTAGARGEVDSARARAQVEQHRARLLQLQRSQQMLVSPEAADTPQSDLGSTINALVSATPPNVSLTRTDYHNLYHPGPANQIGSNYGSNKITSSQQNPMLSRQLSTSGSASSSGYAHSGAGSPAALHTPMSHAPPPSHPPHSPYHRAPRPMLVGGYYDESGYCGGEYRRAPPPHHPAHPAVAPHTPHLDAPPPPPPSQLNCTGNGSSGGGGATSEFVRNELRAVVGARSSRPDLQQMQPDLDPLMHFDMTTSGGEGAATRARTTWPPDQHASTTEAGSAEAAAAAAVAVAGGDETQAAAGAGAGTGATGSGTAAKASLLQKLLSQ